MLWPLAMAMKNGWGFFRWTFCHQMGSRTLKTALWHFLLHMIEKLPAANSSPGGQRKVMAGKKKNWIKKSLSHVSFLWANLVVAQRKGNDIWVILHITLFFPLDTEAVQKSEALFPGCSLLLSLWHSCSFLFLYPVKYIILVIPNQGH